MNELDRIVARTRVEVARRRADRPPAEVEGAARRRLAADPPRGFADALRAGGSGPGPGPGSGSGPARVAVIAEHKRRSPSAGVIREGVEIEDVVCAYERGGASALSVLTEDVGFGGTLHDLARARAASALPILRKDFVVDPYQVPESAAAGADAILLIVAALEPARLRDLHALAGGYGLDVLVEVHDAAELAVAAELSPAIIGINNRDLTTLAVDTARTYELLPGVPDGTVVVSESGLRCGEELTRLGSAGVRAVLVGEALMRAPDMERACRALIAA